MPENVDPVVSAAFTIGRLDKVATAGSCFAQHISRTLVKNEFNYMVTEPGPAPLNYGVFSARFGNIYSVRQLLQLFQRAYGLFEPLDRYWEHKGAYVDPFRPQIQPGGFKSIEALEADREDHLAAVRRMFETCDVFIFTLGLTEAWRSTRDGAVFPSAPGVAGSPCTDVGYEFCNFSVEEMIADLRVFVAKFRIVRPGVKIILTVSPVPLIATFEKRHVLVSTTYSKSALRVVAEMASKIPLVAYFPSYEIVIGHHVGNRYFEEDLRSVKPEGVDRVMHLFSGHYLVEASPDQTNGQQLEATFDTAAVVDIEREIAEGYLVVCDEEAIEQ